MQAISNRSNTAHQRRPPDLDDGDARRHQHPGQLHPHQLARLPAEPPDSDNVAEFSITTSVSGADTAGGATSVRMITPSGTNRFTAACSSSTATRSSRRIPSSTTRSGVAKPDLSRHQFGGRVGGPIQKNRLFFFGYYEGFRQTTQTAQNLTIPANPDLLDGVFRYVGTDGVVRSVNVMQLTGLPIDPKLRSDFLSKIPGATNVNNYDVGNSTATRVLNTAGYRFNQTDLNDRNQYGIPARLRDDRPAPVRRGLQLFQRDRRPDRPGLHQPRPAAGLHEFRSEALLAGVALDGERELPERGARRREPGAGAVQQQLGVPGQSATTRRSASPIRSAETVPPIGFQPQGRYTNTYQIGDSASLHARPALAADGRELAAEPRQPVQLRRRVPAGRLRLQLRGPGRRAVDVGAVPGRHQRRGARERQLAGQLARGHRDVGVADVPGRRIRARGSSAASRRTRTTRWTTSPPTCRTTGAGSRTSPSAAA